MSPTPKQMGRRIRKLREERGLSQSVLAKRAKITREYVNKLEAGRYDPTVGVLQRIAKGLGVPVTELLEGKGKEAVKMLCRYEACGQRTATIDEDGACPRCHGLAAMFLTRIENNILERPTFSELGPKENLPRLPAPANTTCAACSETVAAKDDDPEIYANGKPMHLHRLCREILLTV